MGTIRDLLHEHRVLDLGPLPAPRLAPGATLVQALPFMARARRGAVVVLEGERPVGILTERDVVHRVPLERSARGAGHVTLAEVMSAPPGTVVRRASLAEAIGLMVRRRFRHLVVTGRNGELRGLLTAADVVQYVTDQFPEETVNLPPRLHQTFARPEGG